MKLWTLGLLVAILVLPGCSDPHTKALASLGPLHFDAPMEVATTQHEKETRAAAILVAWGGDSSFGILGAGETDLAAKTVVVGGQAYTTETGYGWLQQSRDQAVSTSSLSSRLVLWDLRLLLQDPGVTLTVTGSGAEKTVHGVGHVAASGVDVTLDATVRDGAVVHAVIASPQGRESPFTFTPSRAAFPFPLEKPSPVRSVEEVAAGDATSKASHRTLIGWIQAYGRTRNGAMPDDVTPETLRVEVLASGGQWPQGAYDGKPLANQAASGHFLWTKCGANDAQYTGYGWHGRLVVQGFGRGCAGSS